MSLMPARGEPILISDEAARALVDEQFPDLADEELGRRYTLEDHVAIRIGDRYGALFPRLAQDDEQFARAADLIAPRLRTWPFPRSAPIAGGVPGHGFPYHWTLVNWISASTAAFVPLQQDSARALGQALRAIHVPAPADAPACVVGADGLAPLVPRWERMLAFAALHGAPENRELDADAADALFREGVDASVDIEPMWIHGRLEPRAILSDRGTFAGLLIWQHYGRGDVAVDLGTAAVSVPRHMRGKLHEGYGPMSHETAMRGRSYMMLAALRYIELDDPFMARMAWERLIEFGLVSEA